MWLALPLAVAAACTGVDADVGITNDAGADVTPGAMNEGGLLPLGPVLDDRYAAGERLKPNFLDVAGERQFLDWYDEQLGLHCSFRPLANGELRCVPTAPRVNIAAGSFADPSCTVRLAQDFGPSCTATPPIIALLTGCDTRIFRTAGPATAVGYVRSGAACQAQAIAGGYRVGAEIPSTAWVRGTVEVSPEDTGPAVHAEIVRGEDGSSGFYRWAPRTLATECAWTAGSSVELHCIPKTLSSHLGFVGTACAESVFTKPVGCTQALVGRRVTTVNERCIGRTTAIDYHLLDGGYDGLSSMQAEDGGCVPAASISAARGEVRLDLAGTFGRAEPVRVQTAGRLAASFARLPSGVRARLGWYDPVLATSCELTPAIDGSVRCLPMAPNIETTAWTNSACTAPKTAAYVAPEPVISCQSPVATCPTDCALPEKPSFVSAIDTRSGCVQQRRRIYAVGGVAAAPIWIRPERNAAACRQVTRGDEAVYDVTERAATEFAEATPNFP